MAETTAEARDAAARAGAGARNVRARKPVDQVVIREFPAIGRYKVRLVKKSEGDSRVYLDIREYAESAAFQGFTRRGIRLSLSDDVPKLRLALEEAMESARSP